MPTECEMCELETKHLFLTISGYVCGDCMSAIDDEQFESDQEERGEAEVE